MNEETKNEEKLDQGSEGPKEINLNESSADEVKEFINTLEKQRRGVILSINVATAAQSTVQDALNAITLLEKQQGVLSSVLQDKLSTKHEKDSGEVKEQ